MWTLARNFFSRGPVPAPKEVIPDGIFRDSNDEKKKGDDDNPWTTWKKKRLRLGDDDPKDESVLLETCAAWFDPALADRLPDLLLSGPFESTWCVSSVDGYDDYDDENEDERLVVRVSCVRWETTCILARAIVCDFERAIAAGTSSDERKRRARRIVVCSKHAVKTLQDWWTTGNGSRWAASGVSVPLEANVVYFQTTRDLGELIYDVACVDIITEPKLVCDKSFTQVALDIVSRANRLVHRVSEDAPARVHDMARTTCDAIVASVAEKIVRAAVGLKTLEKPCIAWSHVASWKDRRLNRIDNDVGLTAIDLVSEKAEVSTLRQFARSTILEAHDEHLDPQTAHEAWGVTKPDDSFNSEILFRV